MRASTIISSISIVISILSIMISLATVAPHFRWAADTVYMLSVWSESKERGVTLRYLGVIPVASCYAAGASVEEMKRMCVGRRYRG